MRTSVPFLRLLSALAGLTFIAVADPHLVRAQNAPQKPAVAKDTRLALVPDLIRQAMATAEQITDPGTKASALCIIADSRGMAGNGEGAKTSLVAAKQTAERLTDLDAYTDNMRKIGMGQARWKDLSGAKQTFEAAKQRGLQKNEVEYKVASLAETAAAQSLAGLEEDARASFDEAIIMARQITQPIPKTFALAIIARNYARANNLPMAKTMAHESQQASAEILGGDNERYWRDRTRGLEVVGALVAAGDMPAAITLTDGITDEYMKSCALWAIATAQAKSRDFTSARQTVARITNDDRKHWALGDVQFALASTGDLSGAKQVAEQIPDGTYLRNRSWMNIANANAKMGDFASATQTITLIRDEGVRMEALSHLAVAQAHAKNTTAAKQVSEQIINPFWKAVTLAHIADAIVASANPPSARK